MKKMIFRTAILLISFIIYGVVAPHSAYSQRLEKKVGSNTYIYDYDKKRVYNKSVDLVPNASTSGYYLEPTTIVKDVFRKILSNQRIDALKKERVVVLFECNAAGKVESVRFLFPSRPFLTPEEVKGLETEFLKQRLPLSVEKGIQRVAFGYPCIFRTL